jgi:hypothetical protein
MAAAKTDILTPKEQPLSYVSVELSVVGDPNSNSCSGILLVECRRETRQNVWANGLKQDMRKKPCC